MNNDQEILNFLFRHLGSIFDKDISNYHQTTSADLTLYEWFVTPHRVVGLDFHDFMINESARRGTIFGVENSDISGDTGTTRFDSNAIATQL